MMQSASQGVACVRTYPRTSSLTRLSTGRAQAVDALTPLGRGQVQLVTGVRGAGKTALVLDAVLAQQRSSVRCIYAAVGQRCG